MKKIESYLVMKTLLNSNTLMGAAAVIAASGAAIYLSLKGISSLGNK